jgi:hypothetical protein
MGIGGHRATFREVIIYNNGGSGSAKTIDWLSGDIQKVAMTDDCVFTFDNPIVGVCRLFINNNAPLGPYSATWPDNVVWKDNVPPSFTKDRTALTELYYDGTNYFGQWNEYY